MSHTHDDPPDAMPDGGPPRPWKEPGAHTFAFDAAQSLVCAFLPETHRAALYHDVR
jgi:hypothetical protein